jgi:hypothetical protein
VHIYKKRKTKQEEMMNIKKFLSFLLLVVGIAFTGNMSLVAQYKASLVIPNLFAYHCDNYDQTIQDCPAYDPQFKYEGGSELVYLHTWVQVVNLSGVNFDGDDKIRLYLYDKNGSAIVNNCNGVYAPEQSTINGYLDLLALNGGQLNDKEAVFVFVQGCFCNEIGEEAPSYAELVLENTAKPEKPLYVHVGWEQHSIYNTPLQEQEQFSDKAGTIIDHEKVIF